MSTLKHITDQDKKSRNSTNNRSSTPARIIRTPVNMKNDAAPSLVLNKPCFSTLINPVDGNKLSHHINNTSSNIMTSEYK